MSRRGQPAVALSVDTITMIDAMDHGAMLSLRAELDRRLIKPAPRLVPCGGCAACRCYHVSR